MPLDGDVALKLQQIARGEVDEQQAGARVAQQVAKRVEEAIASEVGIVSLLPCTSTKPGRPPRWDMSSPPSVLSSLRDLLATKNVSAVAMIARAASSNPSRVVTGTVAAAGWSTGARV